MTPILNHSWMFKKRLWGILIVLILVQGCALTPKQEAIDCLKQVCPITEEM